MIESDNSKDAARDGDLLRLVQDGRGSGTAGPPDRPQHWIQATIQIASSMTNFGLRKLYGLLESPSLPPSIPTHQFKLFLVGRTGSGKTCLVSWLAGLQGWSYTLGESPGVRVTQVRLILTQLDNIMTQLYSSDLLALFADSETRYEPAGHIQTPFLGRGGQCGEILVVIIRVII